MKIYGVITGGLALRTLLYVGAGPFDASGFTFTRYEVEGASGEVITNCQGATVGASSVGSGTVNPGDPGDGDPGTGGGTDPGTGGGTDPGTGGGTDPGTGTGTGGGATPTGPAPQATGYTAANQTTELAYYSGGGMTYYYAPTAQLVFDVLDPQGLQAIRVQDGGGNTFSATATVNGHPVSLDQANSGNFLTVAFSTLPSGRFTAGDRVVLTFTAPGGGQFSFVAQPASTPQDAGTALRQIPQGGVAFKVYALKAE